MELFGTTKIGPEILAEIRKLHFQTRRLANEGVSGQYRSAFRGRGMEFEEVREYRPGDDVRSIDWKVTARKRVPYVKSFREERELTVMIAVDVSASTFTGTRGQLRETLLAKVGAVLTLIALQNNDQVGLVTFSDTLQSYHPPRKARGAVWRILQEVLGRSDDTASGGRTDLGALCLFLNSVLKRRAIVFLLSDFLDDNYETALGALAKRHDVTACIVTDPADVELPPSGLVEVSDPESGTAALLDCSDEPMRREFRRAMQEAEARRTNILRRHRVNVINLQTDQPFMPALQLYFSRRTGRVQGRSR